MITNYMHNKKIDFSLGGASTAAAVLVLFNEWKDYTTNYANNERRKNLFNSLFGDD